MNCLLKQRVLIKTPGLEIASDLRIRAWPGIRDPQMWGASLGGPKDRIRIPHPGSDLDIVMDV